MECSHPRRMDAIASTNVIYQGGSMDRRANVIVGGGDAGVVAVDTVESVPR